MTNSDFHFVEEGQSAPSKDVTGLLFDNSAHVEQIIPINWNYPGAMSDPLEEWLSETTAEEIAELFALTPEQFGWIKECQYEPEEVLEVLQEIEVTGFIVTISARCFERSGPRSWSSTCSSMQFTGYSPTLEGIPAVIERLLEEARPHTHREKESVAA